MNSVTDSVISHDEILAYLDKVLQSAVFTNAGRVSDLLRYVVTESLAGDADRLKGYTIAVEVFDRPIDFDPNIDSVVRVEARRLRSKLLEYYDGVGADDKYRIYLPKGSYKVSIDYVPNGPDAIESNVGPDTPNLVASPSPTTYATPTVAVLPFDAMSSKDEDVTSGEIIAVELTALLDSDPNIDVVPRRSVLKVASETKDIRETGAILEAHYILDGTVRSRGDKLRVTATLDDTRSGKTVWSRTSYVPTDADDPEVAAAESFGDDLLGLSGFFMISRAEGAANRPLDDLTVGELVERAASQLHYIYDRDVFEEGAGAAERAIALDPTHAMAHLWLASANMHLTINGWATDYVERRAATLAHLEQALKLDFNDPLILLVGGDILAWLGEPERGTSLIEPLIRTPSPPAVGTFFYGQSLTHAARTDEAIVQLGLVRELRSGTIATHAPARLAVALFESGDAASALETMERVNTFSSSRGAPITRVPLICMLEALGQRDRARSEADSLKAEHPGYTMEFAEWLFPIAYPLGDVADRYLSGLRAVKF